jgi:protein-disulfide isomerase
MLQYKQMGGKENYEIMHTIQMKQIEQMVEYYKANPGALDKAGKNPSAQNDTTAPSKVPLSQEMISSIKENIAILGNKDAQISWIEYSDLECPYCKKFNES